MKSVSLADALRGGVPQPGMLADGFLYRGAVHLLAGAPDSGKTTLALSWALQVIRDGGTVMFIDEEGGRRIVADRLVSLGATAEEAESIAYYPFPGRTREGWTSPGWDDLVKELAEHEPVMILIDSVAAVMAIAGMDENSNTDVAVLWNTFTRVTKGKLKAAVVLIDHLAKNAEDSRYSRGASAKLAASDVMYKAEVVSAWDRDSDGRLRLTITKDREGHLRRSWKLNVLRGPLRFEPDSGPDEFKPTRYMELCSEAIERHQRDGGNPVSKSWFTGQVPGRKQFILKAVDELTDGGYLEAAGTVRGNPTYRLRRSFEAGSTARFPAIRFPVPSGSRRFPEPVPGSRPIGREPDGTHQELLSGSHDHLLDFPEEA